MIHLLLVMAKVVERIILRKMTKYVELEDIQYGSRKNRSTHDAFKQMSEFIEYSKGMKVGMVTMDVEGGFDKVGIDCLSTVLAQRGYPEDLVRWMRRSACGRSTRLRFNGRTSKTYYINKGVPQGSPLSPFLFGVYVADVFKPRIQTRLNFRRMVSSYVDDGGILVATPDIESTKEGLVECWEDCNKVAKSRGMGFSSNKMDWIGFSEESWGTLRVGEEDLKEVKEIRILGYRMDKKRSMGVHMEYWLDRGIGVKRRIAALGRRFRSHGGLGARECVRLVQGVYMPTVYYGLEFVGKNKKLIKEIQTNLNDTLRSTFRSPLKYANKILMAETGTVPTQIEGRYRERKSYGRHLKYKYGGNLLWFGCIAEKWKDDRLKEEMQWSNKNLLKRPKVRIAHTKEAAIKEHTERWEEGPGQEVWVYSDGSKRNSEVERRG